MRKDCVIFCFNDTQFKVLRIFNKLRLIKLTEFTTYAHVLTENNEFIEVSCKASRIMFRFVTWILYRFMMDDISMERAERLSNCIDRAEERMNYGEIGNSMDS